MATPPALAYDATSPRPAAPVGLVQSPGLVVGLILVTLGIYGFIWRWRITREVDADSGNARRAHSIFRIGLLLMVLAIPLYLIGLVSTVAAVFAGSGSGLGMLLVLAGAGMLLTGGIMMLMGDWRVWNHIHDEETKLAWPKPLSPGMQLALFLVPLMNLVGFFVVPYRTLAGLNRIWEARAKGST